MIKNYIIDHDSDDKLSNQEEQDHKLEREQENDHQHQHQRLDKTFNDNDENDENDENYINTPYISGATTMLDSRMNLSPILETSIDESNNNNAMEGI
eukprot:Pgem_evm1s9161